MRAKSQRRGFSLIELLVCLGLIAILLGFLLPAVQRVRQAAARAQSANNLHQICLAMHEFHDNYKKLPPAFDKHGELTTTLHVHLLPYLEQDAAYKRFVNDKKVTDEFVFMAYRSPEDS